MPESMQQSQERLGREQKETAEGQSNYPNFKQT